MVTENTTPNRGYQEPAVGNTLEVDVGRLIAALRSIDTDMAGVLAAIVTKAGLNSPAFAGTPTAPTAAPGTDSGQLATTAFVKAALAALVDSAPGALDTLNELAAAIGDDPNFASTMAALIGTKADAASTTAALSGKAALLSFGVSDNSFDDADELAYVTGTTQKRGTLAGLISSIFKTARTIANAQFAAASFKLFNATSKALTFDITGLLADRKLTLPNRDVDLSLVPVVAPYTSADLTITSAGTFSLTHGLGVVPSFVQIFIVCQVADGGFAVGDVVPIGYVGYGSGALGIGIAITLSSTSIDGKFGSAASVFYMPAKSSGAITGLTNANWKVRVRAWP